MTADGVRGAHASYQAPRYRLQKRVTDRMALRVVYGLEVIHIHEQYRQRRMVTQRGGHRLRQSVIEQHSIGQLCQKVVLGQI